MQPASKLRVRANRLLAGALWCASLGRPVRAVERVLFFFGLAALGWCLLAYAEAALYQAWQQERFERLRRERPAELPGESPAAAYPADPHVPLGRIEIRRIGLSAVILPGVGAGTLRRGVGHIPGTARPGEPGNVGLAGHRDTFFRGLRELRRDDFIELTTLDGTRFYRVRRTQIVEPRETYVLEPAPRQSLTLVTCFPFDFIGRAPQRFIVSAEEVDSPSGAAPAP